MSFDYGLMNMILNDLDCIEMIEEWCLNKS